MQKNTIARRSVPDQVARAILDFLKTEGYGPGDKIPTTKALCERFDVGYPTLREAIQQLETLGFVTVRHGSGIYVENVDEPLLVANPMDVAVGPKVFLDLIEARRAIEPIGASLAALWVDEAQINEMKSVLQQAGACLNDDAELTRLNMAFHRLVAQASGNEVFAQLMTVLTQFFVKEQLSILNIYAAREKDHEEHWRIFEAIEQRDAAEAEKRMTDHLAGVEQALRRHFASHPHRDDDAPR